MFDMTGVDPPILPDTELCLSVTGVDRNGDPVEGAMAQQRVVVRAVTGPPLIDISFPPDGHDLTTDESAGFVAYGTFVDHDAVSAMMNAVPADYLYSENGFWSAVFPPLTTGEYALLVVDTANHSAAKSDLTVP
jgi:hypothetical protein